LVSISQEINTQRLDVWLFRTRLLKTRALAARIIRTGRVRITHNGKCERILKPHTKVRAGDVITFMRERELIHVEVLGNPLRRGPASEAALHYQPFGG
jgi:ribosome-associated heat shock protein Hsp15